MAEIAVPAGEAWSYRLDFTNLPAYNPDVTELVRVADGSGLGGVAGLGARYQFMLATPAGPHLVTLAVTRVVENAEVSADIEGAMTATETFRVEPSGDGACRVSLSLWLDIPGDTAPAVRDALLAGGRRQIRNELDAMQANLAAPSASQ